MEYKNKELFHDVDLIAEDKIDKAINDIACLFQLHVGATTGDITPEQQSTIDNLKNKLFSVISDVAIQNSSLKDNEEWNDFAYLDIINSWQNDDETSTESMVSESGEHIFTYIYHDNIKSGDGIYILTGDSWKEIFDNYFKGAILDYLHDVTLDEQTYFDDEEMEILNQVYNNTYSNESANDENINNDQETLDNAVKENKIGIVLFNKFIPANVIINNIHNADKYKKIYSIEDPVQTYNDNAIQLQINNDYDFNYPNAIKQVLRHDPDVIVIDDVKMSKETANTIATSAKLGHLVFVGIDEGWKNKAHDCFVSLCDKHSDIDDYLIGYIGFENELVNDITTNKEL